MNELRSPVAVFAYNRPEHLRRTLSALSRAELAKDTALLIFCDGAKAGQDPGPIVATQAVAQDKRWAACFASHNVVTAESNRGLAASIIGGVTRVLKISPTVIVLEDDMLVAPDFLRFLNDCLTFYHTDFRIGSVTGFCPLRSVPVGYSHDVYVVPRNCSNGWGIWKDRWEQIEWDMGASEQIWRESRLRKSFVSAGPEQLYRLWRQSRGRIDSWSIRVDVWLALTGRFTIYPIRNRVENIGFDGSGVHSKEGKGINNVVSRECCPYRLEPIDAVPSVLSAFRKVYSPGLLRRFLHRIRNTVLTLSR